MKEIQYLVMKLEILIHFKTLKYFFYFIRCNKVCLRIYYFLFDRFVHFRPYLVEI